MDHNKLEVLELLTGVYGHVSGEVVVGVEDLPTLGAGIALRLAGGQTGEAGEAGEVILCLPHHFALLREGKCWEPEVLLGRCQGRREDRTGYGGREEATPGVPGPQQAVVAEQSYSGGLSRYQEGAGAARAGSGGGGGTLC